MSVPARARWARERGSWATQRCIDIIRRWRDAPGLTVVSGTFYFGGMPQVMALQNIRRFAAEVMPAFAETVPQPMMRL